MLAQPADQTVYYTARSTPWPEHAIRYTKPVGDEEAHECGVCFEPLRFVQASRHTRRVVATNCECIRVNQLFHAKCMTQELLRNHRVRDGAVEIRCPFARHVVSAGDLRPIFDALFDAPSSSSGVSDRSRGSRHSDRSDKSKEKWEDDLSPPGSDSSWGSLDSKTRDVVNLLRPGRNRYDGNWKARELREMNDRFGEPHDEDQWCAWKGRYACWVDADFGAGTEESWSVMLDQFSSTSGSAGSQRGDLSPSEEEYFTPQGKCIE